MAKINLKPLSDRVIVRAMETEEKTKEKPIEGTIMAVGPGKVTEDGKQVILEVKEGDKVLYGKYSGTEITVEGEEYLIMRETDIFAIIGK